MTDMDDWRSRLPKGDGRNPKSLNAEIFGNTRAEIDDQATRVLTAQIIEVQAMRKTEGPCSARTTKADREASDLTANTPGG